MCYQCKKTKTQLSSALEKAKEIWQANKRRKIEAALPEAIGSSETAQPEATRSPSRHLAATRLSLDDTPLLGIQQQV